MSLAKSTTRYLDYKRGKNPSDYISEETSRDLNLDEVFLSTDFTTSNIGEQFLYQQLHRQRNDTDYKLNEEVIESLGGDWATLEKIDEQLRRLPKKYSSNVLSLFSDQLTLPTKLRWFIIQIARWLPLLTLGLLIISGNFLFFWLFLLFYIANILIHYINKTKQMSFEDSIPQLAVLLNMASKLCSVEQLKPLVTTEKEAIKIVADVKKSSYMFQVDRIVQSEPTMLAWGITELLKILFLIEPYTFNRAVKIIEGHQHHIETLYLFVARVDQLLSTMELREEFRTSQPTEAERGVRLSCREMYNPLVEDCVPNSLTIRDKSLLLTGSNMSGKSTFIRTIAINYLFAKNLNCVFADHFACSDLENLQTMINVQDDIMSQKSLFFAEVSIINQMVERSQEGNNLFLIDELFKSTNTEERIGLARAILEHLANHHNLVVVSTHDIELADLLHNEFDLYHFCEQLEGEEVLFDYLLKRGKLTDFNAIRIVERSGVEPQIVERAYSTIGELEKNRRS